MHLTLARRLEGLLLTGLLAVSLACSGGSRAGSQTRRAAPTDNPPPQTVPTVLTADIPSAAPTRPDDVVDLRKAIAFLASDELEGRGVETEGLNQAADYIADTFKQLGLQPLPGGDYFQTFKLTTSYALADDTALSAELGGGGGDGPASYALREQFTPVGEVTGEGAFDGPVIFAGYGITNEEQGYDDYAGVDVKGKIVLVLRYEPHNAEGKSRWVKAGGDPHDPHAAAPQSDWSMNATFNAKAKDAAARGAAALVVVNPPNFHPLDPLVVFTRPLQGERAALPVIQVKREVAEVWLKAGGAPDLKTLQAAIDESGKPHSLALDPKVKVSGEVRIDTRERNVKNVAGILPGKGPNKGEYVVVGAHYDHLGRGGFGSRSPGEREIHNGADDNASGTAALLEAAETFARRGPQDRSMLFVAFTAEEMGLVGSNYFVNHSPVPMDKVAAMLNLDMVGRIEDDILYVGGGGTAASFEGILADVDSGSPLQFKSIGKGGLGPSDHMSFAVKKVPVIFLFSGLHADYHRPSDDADRVNYDGLQKAVDVAVALSDAMAQMPREQFVAVTDDPHAGMGPGTGRTGQGSGAFLGSIPDPEAYGADGKTNGVKVSGAVPGSPADRAGLKEGDVLTQWNGKDIGSIYGLTDQLRRAKPGDQVKLGVLRDGKTIELEATLTTRAASPG